MTFIMTSGVISNDEFRLERDEFDKRISKKNSEQHRNPISRVVTDLEPVRKRSDVPILRLLVQFEFEYK